MTDFALFLKDLKAADRSGEWRKGPTISFDDMNKGTGNVQRISSAEFFGKQIGKSTGKSSSPTAAKSPTIMGFGKHRDRQMADVKARDPSYWSWCLRDVSGFAKRTEKAGLLNDESNEGPDDDHESNNDIWTVNR